VSYLFSPMGWTSLPGMDEALVHELDEAPVHGLDIPLSRSLYVQ
jgi:hypothetical protein